MARVMPASLDAEMNILGVAFLNNYDVVKICEEMSYDMFFDERNRYIFNAIKNLHSSKVPIDITTIKNELEKINVLDKVRLDYLSEVIDSVATSANLDYYIKIVKDKYLRRSVIDAATAVVTNAYDENDIDTFFDETERNILNIVRARSVGEFLPISQVLIDAKAKLEMLAKNKKIVTGLETGFIEFDKITTGFQPGELIILAARPGMGKTALALNMATEAAANTNKAIAIFNLEMPADMLVNRMVSAIGRIDSKRLTTGYMQENDWKRYNEAMLYLNKTKIFIEANSSITTPEIRAKCRRLASSEDGLAFVVIDYLQLISSGSKRVESRQVEVSEISRSLKTMALELGVPVLALAQLSRAAEKRDGNEPALSDLRESGSLEQDADIVLFINRKDYYGKSETESAEKSTIVPADLIIAKHRKGSRGKVELRFDLSKSAFKNLDTGMKEGIE